MEKSFKNKNLLVVVFEILVIALALGGFTYATQRLLNNRTKTIIVAGEYNLDYVGEQVVKVSNLEPMADNLVDINATDNVIRVEFSLKGVKENKNDDLIYDVMLTDMNIDCSLLNKYTKWNLYKNGKLISNGSMDPLFDGNVLSDNMRLTDIASDLPKYNEGYDTYVLIFWISESCDNLETCKLVDQSNILDSKMDMKVFIALYSGDKVQYERIPNYDSSCANKPVLYNNMIPVNYKNGEWVLANDTNSDKANLWYDYSNQNWANAIIVKDANKYTEVGSKIEKDDILANMVWIPRYRYKLWNVTDEITDSYQAYDNGVDIVFERGIGKTTNDIKNDVYLTHYAFGDNLKGFWVSKYEVSKTDGIYKSVVGANSYRNESLDNYKNIISNLNYDYALGDKSQSHMISNLEWGAVAYLSHSKYGLCSGDGCDGMAINSTYISGSNKQDTTTRNVYGVYDMAGASKEYVLGNLGIGSASSEVNLGEGNLWNNGHGLSSERDYILRGGISYGMYSYGEIGMDSVEISTRFCITDK